MASGKLPKVPKCGPPAETCTVRPSLASGKPVVMNPDTGCTHPFEGQGILMVSPDGSLKAATGADKNPIRIPEVKRLLTGSSFPFLLVMNASGQILAIPAKQTNFVEVLTSAGGSWQQKRNPVPICVDDDLVCGDCEPDFISAWKVTPRNDGSGKSDACLIKMELSDLLTELENAWESSNTVEIQGDGSADTPYNANVKKSPDGPGSPGPGYNLLELRSNGLFITIPISAAEGNQIEWLADGLYVGPPSS